MGVLKLDNFLICAKYKHGLNVKKILKSGRGDSVQNTLCALVSCVLTSGALS